MGKSDEQENLKISSQHSKLNLSQSKPAKLNITSEKKFNLKAKNEYHTQGLAQSNISFWFSLGSSVVGFIVIISFAIFGKENADIGLFAGTIIEIVAALFFYMYKNSNKTMIEFFEKLRKDANTTSALDIAKTIDDVKIRDQAKVKLALHLIGIDEDKICNKICDISRNNCVENDELKE